MSGIIRMRTDVASIKT